MTFRDPWIDPRVARVRTAAVEAYLRQKGWKALPDPRPNFHEFEPPSADDNAPIVGVALREQARDYTQRMIELITDVAQFEKRSASQILDDIVAIPAATNGPAAPASASQPDPATP